MPHLSLAPCWNLASAHTLMNCIANYIINKMKVKSIFWFFSLKREIL